MSELTTKKTQTGLEIAVIGMAGRFPGANAIDMFWGNLKNGVESVTFFSDDELIAAGINAETVKNPAYVKAKGYLEEIQYFDSEFFNYTPNDAAVMDPQVRIFHECAWQALENAGYDLQSYPGLIGLYAGYNPNMLWKVAHLLQRRGNSELFELENLNSNFFTTLICYKLNLKGPGVSINTACSTSLVAIHMACRALLIGEADMVLAGGVSITLPQKEGYLYQEGMVMSSDGHGRPFDAGANGTAPGNGVGIVVLKRLVKAIKDRDHIYAIIKGTAINNDGNRKTGYTAPSVIAQSEVIRAAQRMAGVEPETISFIETHGTATPLGDPIEIEALKMAFANTTKKKFCRLGFVKANIGHLDAAAGVAGFIKTTLALYYHLIPPTVNFQNPNTKIDFENSPFYIDLNPAKWSANEFPLRAGVSSFGIGGTNAHVILEEYVPGESELPSKKAEPLLNFNHLLLLSAKTQTALDKMTENLADYLKQNPGLKLTDVFYTLQVGRSPFNYRRILVCADVDEAVASLLSPTPGKMRTYIAGSNDRPVLFMFPGLGSQYVDMGAELYRTVPVFREAMDECFKILKKLGETEVKEILYPSSENNKSYKTYRTNINQFDSAQIVIFIFEYALAQLLIKWGIKPHAMIGYSFGEYTAACISGVFSLEDALTLVTGRGKLIEGLPPSVMTSVPMNKEAVQPFLNDRLFIAIDNGESCIIGGTAADIDAFESQMKEKRLICIRLTASYALHTPQMAPIHKEFETQVGRLTLQKPKIPFISNVTGKWINPQDAVNARYWATHLCQTVRFSDGLKELMNIENAIFVEVGPGIVLSTLAAQYSGKGSTHSVVNLVRSPEQKIPDIEYLTRKIGALWLYGSQVDWGTIHAGEKKNRVPLPAYPFDKIYYDIDTPLKYLNAQGQPGIGNFMKQAPRPSAVFPESKRHSGKVPYVAPRNKAEQLLVQIWEDILGISPIGVNDNLLEMGVTSLKGIQFVNRFKEQLGEIIHVTAVFDAPTPAELAAYFSKHYPGSLAKITRDSVHDDTSNPLPKKEEKVTIEKIMRFRRLLPDIPGSMKFASPKKNPRAVFVLSPPRTGSTLLRVILAGHPKLFAPPELNLLPYHTLRERKSVFVGPLASHLQGAIRALMEIKKCSVEEAQQIMEQFETQDVTVQEFFKRIQAWIGDRLLVDKSPGYSYDIDIMDLIEQYFQDPLYINLTRHPYGMIHSFVEARMDLLNGQQVMDELDFTSREFAEVIYTNSVGNILEFLKKVPQERQLLIKFEDLAQTPGDIVKNICRFLDINFDSEMLQPYKEREKRMTDGIYSEGQMIGDPKFHLHKRINAEVVDNWKKDYIEDFLGEPTLEIAAILGYQPIHEDKKEIQLPDAIADNPILLKGSPGAAVNMFFVHDRIGHISPYLELCKLLDSQYKCWGIEPGKLKNYVPQNWTIEDTAAKYIRTLKKVQPQGPYNIVAWSFGGHIAFEMTRQLEQTGNTVAFLTFVDCPGPMGSPGKSVQKFSLETEKEYIKKFYPGTDIWKRLDKITNIHHIWPFMVDLLKAAKIDLEQIPWLGIDLLQIHAMHIDNDDNDDNEINIETLITYLNYFRTFGNAGDLYVPLDKINAALHFINVRESIGFTKEHWQDFCQNPIIYHEIEGNHNSVFQNPQVIELARLINKKCET